MSFFTELTASNRVVDVAIPDTIKIQGEDVALPFGLKNKDVHFLINGNNQVVRAAWVNKGLVDLFKAFETEDKEEKINLLNSSLNNIYPLVSQLIKNGIISQKKGPGAMSFSQAHEDVPLGCVMISERTWKTLCDHNSKWKDCNIVIATRFPNLGPGTTRRLKLVVDSSSNLNFKPTSIANRINNLSELLSLYSNEEVEPVEGFLDAFYFNPVDLKGFEGDADGDLLFLAIDSLQKGPQFKKRKVERKPAEGFSSEDIDKLFTKARKTSCIPLEEYLPYYFDQTPIGPATYAVRWVTWIAANNLRTKVDHPLQEAWKKESGRAINLIEFVMDIRKGTFTDSEITKNLNFITNVNIGINEAKKSGNWFAKTVTSSQVEDIDQFINVFPSLQAFVDFAIPTKKSI